MKAVVTGASGTLGTALGKYLEQHDIEVIAWDRQEVPVDSYQTMEAYLRKTQPRILFHLAVASQPIGRRNESWVVNYEWASELAWLTRALRIRFVFPSSVMVFSPQNPGPYTISSVPDAAYGYGY
jgi:dTDP-4-dehydrorhamnose reductase